MLFLALCTTVFVLSLFGIVKSPTLDANGYPVISFIVGVSGVVGVIVFGFLALLGLIGETEHFITDEEKAQAEAEDKFVKATHFATHPVTSLYNSNGGI